MLFYIFFACLFVCFEEKEGKERLIDSMILKKSYNHEINQIYKGTEFDNEVCILNLEVDEKLLFNCCCLSFV